MAIATKRKPTTKHHKKRVASHHRQSKHYLKSYAPYLPIAAIVTLGIVANAWLGQHSTLVLGDKTELSQAALLNETNTGRAGQKLAPLSLNDQLQLAAQAKADDMAKNNYWSHNSPDGREPWNFVTSTGYQYQAAGENLAYGFKTATALNNAWLGSVEHRANVLGNYTQVGFGIAQSPDFLGEGPENIVVAMYALPTPVPTEAPVESAPLDATPVSRLQTAALPPITVLIVGLIGGAAGSYVIIRHSIAWRRLLSKGEKFVIHHPVLDTVLVFVAMSAVILNQTSGFIR